MSTKQTTITWYPIEELPAKDLGHVLTCSYESDGTPWYRILNSTLLYAFSTVKWWAKLEGPDTTI
jgi:hypothetical protein